MRTSEKIVLGIVILAFAAALYFEPVMPEKMASHWNAQSIVDGYLPKFWGLFLMPIMCAGLLGMFMLIPKIDPLKKNIAKFRQHYDSFVVLISLFFLYIYGLTLYWNLGYVFGMGQVIAPAIAAIFYYSGVLMEHSKRNWFIGIKTPWTLSSDKVWSKTNKIGGKLFRVAGVLSLGAMLFTEYMMLFMIGPVLIAAAYLVIYSYIEYQKEKRYGL